MMYQPLLLVGNRNGFQEDLHYHLSSYKSETKLLLILQTLLLALLEDRSDSCVFPLFRNSSQPPRIFKDYQEIIHRPSGYGPGQLVLGIPA